VNATDADLGENGTIARYIIVGSVDARLFRVDETGTISVTASLDRELAAVRRFQVVAVDRGSPPATSWKHHWTASLRQSDASRWWPSTAAVHQVHSHLLEASLDRELASVRRFQVVAVDRGSPSGPQPPPGSVTGPRAGGSPTLPGGGRRPRQSATQRLGSGGCQRRRRRRLRARLHAAEVRNCLDYYSAPVRVAKYCDERVCLSVVTAPMIHPSINQHKARQGVFIAHELN